MRMAPRNGWPSSTTTKDGLLLLWRRCRCPSRLAIPTTKRRSASALCRWQDHPREVQAQEAPKAMAKGDMFRRLRGILGGDEIRALEHKVRAAAKSGDAETTWRRITTRYDRLACNYLSGR